MRGVEDDGDPLIVTPMPTSRQPGSGGAHASLGITLRPGKDRADPHIRGPSTRRVRKRGVQLKSVAIRRLRATDASRRSKDQSRIPASRAAARRWTSIQPNPCAKSLCDSRNASASPWSTTGAWGRVANRDRISRRPRRLPHASSPITNGCAHTRPSRRRRASRSFPWRRWSTQTEVSTSTLSPGASWPPARDRPERLLCSAEGGEPPGALARNESFEPGVEDRGLLLQPAQPLCLPEKVLVEVQRGPHMHEYGCSVQMRQGRTLVGWSSGRAQHPVPSPEPHPADIATSRDLPSAAVADQSTWVFTGRRRDTAGKALTCRQTGRTRCQGRLTTGDGSGADEGRVGRSGAL
jgi:hypothetical protein